LCAQVNTLIHGGKQWFLEPPSARGNATASSSFGIVAIADYVTQVLPSLPPEARPLQCTQRAGDVMYVRCWHPLASARLRRRERTRFERCAAPRAHKRTAPQPRQRPMPACALTHASRPTPRTAGALFLGARLLQSANSNRLGD